MGKSKDSMFEDMVTWGTNISTLLREEENPLKEGYLDAPEESKILKMDLIRPAYKWIRDVYETEFAAVLDVKNLLAPEIWARYRAWGGFEDHQEVVLLRQAVSTLRKRIISRDKPDYYKKSKRDAAIKARLKAKKSRSKSRRARKQTS